ncbi:DUF485 domain-containing protein [Bradyrhizobium sp. dw_411]|uniref:DUF485 domain-containing protein n=1 Tax=Bradyrhizobium sp. dw_411 TaxID=2720082 RepID=UPI001BCB8E61|nr:DUF485 domain-containing protein [Bradyrhizobium sp. dw_411]
MALAEDVIAPAFAVERGTSRDIPSAVVRIEETRRSIVRPLFIASTAFYVLGLIVLAYFPDVAGFKITGSINVAYVLALAQFVMTFAVAYIYSRRANRFIDPLVAETLAAITKALVPGVGR